MTKANEIDKVLENAQNEENPVETEEKTKKTAKKPALDIKKAVKAMEDAKKILETEPMYFKLVARLDKNIESLV